MNDNMKEYLEILLGIIKEQELLEEVEINNPDFTGSATIDLIIGMLKSSSVDCIDNEKIINAIDDERFLIHQRIGEAEIKLEKMKEENPGIHRAALKILKEWQG